MSNSTAKLAQALEDAQAVNYATGSSAQCEMFAGLSTAADRLHVMAHLSSGCFGVDRLSYSSDIRSGGTQTRLIQYVRSIKVIFTSAAAYMEANPYPCSLRSFLTAYIQGAEVTLHVALPYYALLRPDDTCVGHRLLFPAFFHR